MDSQVMLTAKEAALRLGKSVHWLQTEGKRQGVPCYRVGGRYQYSPVGLNEWFQSRRYQYASAHPVRSSGYVNRQKVAL